MERFDERLVVNEDSGNRFYQVIPCDDGKFVLYADAQAQIEALQRERDEAVREARLQKESVMREREVADSYHQDLVKCEATLDALRDAYDELDN